MSDGLFWIIILIQVKLAIYDGSSNKPVLTSEASLGNMEDKIKCTH